MIEKTPERIAKQVVFKFDGKKVLRGDIDSRITYLRNSLESRYGKDFEKKKEAQEQLLLARENVSNVLIKNMIIDKKVKELKLKVDLSKVDEACEAKFKETKDSFKTEEEYKKALETEKLTEAVLKERLKDDIIAQANLDALFAYYTKDVKDVGEDKAKTYYAANPDEFTEKQNGYNLSQIVLNSKEDANAVKAELDKGADFEKLVAEKSVDEESKKKKGKVDFIPAKQIMYSNPYTECSTKKTGDIVGPVESEGKFYVIKVVEKIDTPAKPFNEVKEEIIKKLTDEEKQAKYAEEEKKFITEMQKDLKVYKDNLK